MEHSVTDFNETEIINAVKGGEDHLFEKIMRYYNRRLYRVAIAIMNDEEEVEDLLQSAYLNAYIKLGSFKGDSAFGTWLTRILINECLKRKKKKQRTEALSDDAYELPGIQNPIRDVMNKELKRVLEEKIAELPEIYRSVFMIREIEELSVKETAELLDISEANVKVRLNRAKEMLRNSISREFRNAELFDFNLIRCNRVVNYVLGEITSAGGKLSIGLQA